MDVFKLVGSIFIKNDEANQQIDETTGIAESASDKLGKAFGAMATGITVAVSACATGVGIITKKAVEAYADYEQLVGGVETLFKDSAVIVEDYANQAYKTAGLSANEYMETVTSFSASLLQSLNGDTAKSAEYANQAIIDMSDNANKMGSDMSLIQSAYQGFAKQNYSMLDNLKLGYGGTQAEMYRLLSDAKEIDETFDAVFSINKKGQLEADFADITRAIHIIQTEMGITGTTAKEAEGTISGSISMMKSSWQNLMSGLAQGNADIPVLVSNVVSSGTQVLENIIPVVKQVLKNIPVAISEISPKAGEAFQTIVNICIGAFDVLTTAIEPTFKLIGDVFDYLSQHTGVLIAIATAIGIITTAITAYNVVTAVKVAMATAEVTTVWALVSAYASQAVALLATLAPYLLIATAIAGVIAVGVLLYKNWDTIKEKAIELAGNLKQKFEEIKTNISEKLSNAKEKVVEIFDNMKQAIVNVLDTIKNVIQVALMFIVELVTFAFELITLPWRFIWENCKEYIIEAWDFIKTAISEALNFISTLISNIWLSIVNTLSPILTTLYETISSVWTSIKEKISSILSSVFSIISSIWNSCVTAISNAVSSIKLKISDGFENAKNIVSTLLENIKSTISSKMTSAKNAVSDVLDSIKKKFNDVWDNCKKIVSDAVEKLKSIMKFEWSLPKLKLPHISISGKFSLNPPSVPKFGIEWYRKAMDNAMILNSPTIFGYGGGKFLGGGEAGSEVVAGSQTLMGMIQDAVSVQNSVLADVLYKILDAIIAMDDNMGGNLRDALSGTALEVNKREFARLVKVVT